MPKTKGKLIVIDGTDGSGKATQVKRIKERLAKEGISVQAMDFPRYYDNFFGKLIGEGLRGEYGDWAHIHPKVASVMYAADRFESSKQIQMWLENGDTVILDRYVSSNQIHQGGKIDDESERKDFMDWLDTMEHEVFAIPRPDMILYLDVPISVTQRLLIEKGNKESKEYLQGKSDAHEDDVNHLEAAKESGLKMIADSNHWVRINCAPEGNMRSIEDIHTEVYQKTKELL